jgi:clan AA aspartic protease (TIGR02281 family)
MSMFGKQQPTGRYRRPVSPSRSSRAAASNFKWAKRSLVVAGVLGAGWAAYAALPPFGRQVWTDHRGAEPVTHRIVGHLDKHNHCYVDAVVNGTRWPALMIDSGSSMPIFGRQHLAGLGINPKSLRYEHHITTVAGPSLAAEITLHELRIGEFVLHDVSVLVAKNFNDEHPLIGIVGAGSHEIRNQRRRLRTVLVVKQRRTGRDNHRDSRAAYTRRGCA